MRIIKTQIAIVSVMIIFLISTVPVFANTVDSLVIQSIGASANEDGQSYTVQMNVSVLDSEKLPIEGLDISSFTITEDTNQIKLEKVSLAQDLPISVIILIDNSGSMLGERLQLAKETVGNFIKKLGNGDQIAVYTFSEKVVNIVEFTDDLENAKNTFSEAKIIADAGTCLYDALFTTVERAKPLSQGRRAVIVLSDGRDTITGSDVCSSSTEQDVIDKANEGGSNVPVYTIGIGTDIDANSLKRIAGQTGGIYNASTDDKDLPQLFDTLLDQLSSEYILKYTSTAAPGVHTITVNVGGVVTSREVNYPGLPPVVSFAYPSNGQEIAPEKIKVSLSVIDRGLPFEHLSFTINNSPIGISGEAQKPPYEYEIDLSQYSDKEIQLGVIVLDDKGIELSSKEITLKVGITKTQTIIEQVGDNPTQTFELTITPTEVSVLSNSSCTDGKICLGGIEFSYLTIGIIGAALIVLVIAIVIISKATRKSRMETRNDISLFSGEAATLDDIAISGTEYARLTITASDDPLMINKQFNLTKSLYTIGRSLNNDIVMPKDNAVSRNHVEIMKKDNVVSVREVMKESSGAGKVSPTYGTFLNGKQLTGETILHDGDEIGLGRRAKLRFQSLESPLTPPTIKNTNGIAKDVTFDGIDIPGESQQDDSTQGG